MHAESQKPINTTNTSEQLDTAVPSYMQNLVTEAGAPEQPFEYELLKGHERTDGSWKTDQQLRMEYIQLTDKLVYDITNGVEVADPVTSEKRIEKPDVVVWLDKSARPLSWLTKELWSTLAPESEDAEVPTMPDFKYVNIDREQWVNTIDPEGVGVTDVNKVDPSIIRSLRSIFIEPKDKRDGITPELDTTPAELDDKTILIVDEVYSSGRTLAIATNFFRRAFPTARIAGRHWMSGIVQKGEARGNRDIPVWYKENTESGRGVGNRNEQHSMKSDNTTQRLGAWFLGTHFSAPDPSSRQLRQELKHLAHNPDVPVLPSFDRPDRGADRISWLNGGLPVPEVLAKMRAIKNQK